MYAVWECLLFSFNIYKKLITYYIIFFRSKNIFQTFLVFILVNNIYFSSITVLNYNFQRFSMTLFNFKNFKLTTVPIL
jgi:hypothetical protein